MKKMAKIVVIGLMMVTMAACGNGGGSGDTAAEDQNFDGELLFTGSSTLAPTISQIADEFQNEFGTWDQVEDSLPAETIQISVSTGGSGAGAKAVLDGTANIGMLARHAREEEREALEEYQEAIIGMDALLMAVNQNNPLGQNRSEITAEEVQNIFSGEWTHWNQVDENLPEEEIVLLVRDVGGGAHGVFQNAMMGEVDVTETAIEVPSMTGLVDRLMDNPLAMGYASFGVAEMHQDDLVAFVLDGVEPSLENILDGTYPVARPLVLVWNGELNPAEAAFMEYIKSEKGIQILDEMGFVPVQ